MKVLGFFYTVLLFTAKAIHSASAYAAQTSAYRSEYTMAVRAPFPIAPCLSELAPFYDAFPKDFLSYLSLPTDLSEKTVSELFGMKLSCASNLDMAETLLKISEEIYPEEVIRPILLNPSFHIVILPENHPILPNFGGRKPEGLYLPNRNLLILKENPHLSESAAKKLLKNELAHAITRDRNVVTNIQVSPEGYLSEKHQLTWEEILPPVLDGLWHVDDHQFRKYKQALANGLNRIRHFDTLQHKAKSQRTLTEQQEYQTYNQAIRGYEPEVQTQEIPQRVVQGLGLKVGSYIEKNIVIQNIERLENGDFLIFTSLAVGSCTMERERNAFLGDHQAHLAALSNLYSQSSQDEVVHYAELASWVEEFPAHVKNTFFPEWCRYMDDYLDIEQGLYCSM